MNMFCKYAVYDTYSGHPHEPVARWLAPRFGIPSHNYCTVLYLFTAARLTPEPAQHRVLLNWHDACSAGTQDQIGSRPAVASDGCPGNIV
jgi:hypothetical protein